jgi:P27 family predicted phage terminase small subunit
LLSKQGNLEETDAAVIELTAMTLARVRRLDKELKTVPLFIANDRGVPIEHPLSKQQATYTTKLSKLSNDLRLTPVTRSKAVEPTYDAAEEAEWTVT